MSLLTFKFQIFALNANDYAVKFYLDQKERLELYQRFIISVSSCNNPGFRIFGLLVTNTTFVSLFFSLISAALVIVQRFLFASPSS
jgi:hypothetical protein